MDFFTVYLPIAGMPFSVLLLLLIGFTVGVCGGFFGIGGAWIVTPALNIFGFPMPYAIGTDLAHMGGGGVGGGGGGGGGWGGGGVWGGGRKPGPRAPRRAYRRTRAAAGQIQFFSQ